MSGGRPRLARKLDARLGPERARVLRKLGRLADRNGAHAYLVGGVVRDLLLGRGLQDVDVAVEGETLELARRFAEESGACFRGHQRFETATVRLPGPWHIDFARTRVETYNRPAALPRVMPADLSADLRRRDFTVNSLAIDLGPSDYGRLIDPLEGRHDLERRTIRAHHERSFLDDPTRAFRAIRFAVRLRFRIDAATKRWIRTAFSAGAFEALSATRLRAEIARLFEEPDWGRIGALLVRADLWGTLDPALGRNPPGQLSRIERSVRRGIPSHPEDRPEAWSIVLAWAVADLSRSAPERLVRRLRPTRRTARTLVEAGRTALRLVRVLGRLTRPSPGRVHRLCSGCSSESLLLARAIAAPPIHRLLDSYLESWRGVRADITGDDLLEAGIRPGPGLALGLAAALQAKLDGRADEPEAQLAIAVRAARRA